MTGFPNAEGKSIVQNMITVIQTNKVYLSDLDGQIGDGDHGMNMNKGFSICNEHLDRQDLSFTQALADLGTVLFMEIGGSMGPIYGTVFMEMADAADQEDIITGPVFAAMLDAGLTGLWDIVQAQVGDKTLIDVLAPSRDAFRGAIDGGQDFVSALLVMKKASEEGLQHTKELVSKYGRSARLGERSRGVLDPGAASCDIILRAMADEMIRLLQ